MILVVDASVAAMWFLPEPHSRDAALLLGSDYDLVAPDLIELEVGSVLLRALRRKEVSIVDCKEALYSILPQAVRTVRAVDHLEAAFDIARTHGGAIYDAIYLAVAHRLDCPLITNDAQLATTGRKAKIDSRMIAEGLPST